MAKKGGKSKGYISSGVHSNVSKSIRNAMRRDYVSSLERLKNQTIAFRKGKRVMITIANPNKEETNKKFIRVPANTVWKDYKSIVPFVM